MVFNNEFGNSNAADRALDGLLSSSSAAKPSIPAVNFNPNPAPAPGMNGVSPPQPNADAILHDLLHATAPNPTGRSTGGEPKSNLGSTYPGEKAAKALRFRPGTTGGSGGGVGARSKRAWSGGGAGRNRVTDKWDQGDAYYAVRDENVSLKRHQHELNDQIRQITLRLSRIQGDATRGRSASPEVNRLSKALRNLSTTV